ncbi:MAG: hypothetical protein ACK4TR_08860 [Phenylobacterium sp.]|uniref:hypothetical protein n=1 Tax=Phenylobacterium sp. TaxID=1871053 RepID=UPI00391B41F7
MNEPSAAQAVALLLTQQQQLLAAIALAEETLNARRKELELVRAKLAGVQLGKALVNEEAQADG